MNRFVNIGLRATAAALACLAAAPAPAQQAPAATANTAPSAIAARLRVDEKERETRDVELVGREGDKLFYRLQGGPREASTTLSAAAIQSAEFDLKLDHEALSQALVARNWSTAAALLYPAVQPLLPYIDLKDNNAIDYALELGTAMFKAANVSRAGAGDTNKVNRLYAEAHRVLAAVTAVSWFPDAEIARLRAIQCLIATGDLKQASKDIEEAREPEVGDTSYGLYWMVEAQLRQARGDTRGCMNAAIKSLAFADKDIETFPDALMLSARCYEDMLEFHRARDVYYEVARLFAQTEWGTAARQKLQSIMDRGLTKAREVSPVENVFFGLDEDMDAKVNALIKGDDEPAPAAATEDEIKEDKDGTPEPAKDSADAQASPPTAEPPAPAAATRPAPAVRQDSQGQAHKSDRTKSGTAH